MLTLTAGLDPRMHGFPDADLWICPVHAIYILYVWIVLDGGLKTKLGIFGQWFGSRVPRRIRKIMHGTCQTRRSRITPCKLNVRLYLQTSKSPRATASGSHGRRDSSSAVREHMDVRRSTRRRQPRPGHSHSCSRRCPRIGLPAQSRLRGRLFSLGSGAQSSSRCPSPWRPGTRGPSCPSR